MAVVVGFYCDVISYQLARPRAAAAAVKSSVHGHGDVVSLTSILNRGMFFQSHTKSPRLINDGHCTTDSTLFHCSTRLWCETTEVRISPRAAVLSRMTMWYAVLGMGCAPLLQCLDQLSLASPGSLNWVPALAGVKAGMSPLSGGR